MAVTQRGTLLACLAIVYVVWGSSYLATRIGVTHLPPWLFGGIRFTLAGILLLGISAWRGWPGAALRREWPTLVVQGFTGVTLVYGLQAWAMQWVPSSTGALLNASSAFWIVGLGLFGARAHRPAAQGWVGLLLGAAGTALLVWPQSGEVAGATALLPQLAILLACVFWAVVTIHMRNTPSALDVISLTGVQMLAGGLLMVPAGLYAGEAAAWHWSTEGLLAMGWLTLFSACIAYTAYGWLARHASPAVVSTYSYVNPAIATLLGYVVLDERLHALQWAGTAVILAAVILVGLPERRRRDAPAGP